MWDEHVSCAFLLAPFPTSARVQRKNFHLTLITYSSGSCFEVISHCLRPRPQGVARWADVISTPILVTAGLFDAESNASATSNGKTYSSLALCKARMTAAAVYNIIYSVYISMAVLLFLCAEYLVAKMYAACGRQILTAQPFKSLKSRNLADWYQGFFQIAAIATFHEAALAVSQILFFEPIMTGKPFTDGLLL